MDASFRELLLSLPPALLVDLVAQGVCSICILRFSNIRSFVYSSNIPSPLQILSELRSDFVKSLGEDYYIKLLKGNSPYEGVGSLHGYDEPTDSDGRTGYCSACLGILHMFKAAPESQVDATIKNVNQREYQPVAQIMNTLSQQEYKFSSFCLEVSLPPSTLIRDRAFWYYLKQRHSNYENGSLGKDGENFVTLKEVVKWLLIEPLEKLLGSKYDANALFRIALIYHHSTSALEVEFLSSFAGPDIKRRRKERNNSNEPSGLAAVMASRSMPDNGESLAFVQRTLASMSPGTFLRHIPSPPSKVHVGCELGVMCYRTPIYIGGRYVKYSRNISQSRWLVDDERMGDSSVQEILGDAIFPLCKGDSYKFHAAGREDIDVRMLGNGRPFIIEILNARTIPEKNDLLELERIINSSKPGWVKARGLRQIGSDAYGLMREGEAEKQKEYTAVVWLSRPVSDADFTRLSSLNELEIQQKTPVRVLHRRSPLIRPKKIHWMRCERIQGSENYFLLHLCTQAGTYIKEFVHGDLGRTFPNLGSILDCEAHILQLDVSDVKMDFF